MMVDLKLVKTIKISEHCVMVVDLKLVTTIKISVCALFNGVGPKASKKNHVAFLNGNGRTHIGF